MMIDGGIWQGNGQWQWQWQQLAKMPAKQW
jgi:hypothetical protein